MNRNWSIQIYRIKKDSPLGKLIFPKACLSITSADYNDKQKNPLFYDTMGIDKDSFTYKEEEEIEKSAREQMLKLLESVRENVWKDVWKKLDKGDPKVLKDLENKYIECEDLSPYLLSIGKLSYSLDGIPSATLEFSLPIGKNFSFEEMDFITISLFLKGEMQEIFNGFVTQITDSKTKGEIPTVSLDCYGISKLLGLSRIINDPAVASVFEKGQEIYDKGITPYTSIFSGDTAAEVFEKILKYTLGARWEEGAWIERDGVKYLEEKYDYALDFGDRPLTFAVSVSALFLLAILFANRKGDLKGRREAARTEAFNAEAYLKFLKQEGAFKFFYPEVKTPIQVLEEVRKSAMLEFFEKPNGVLMMRAPQFNKIIAEVPERDIQSFTTKESDANLLNRCDAQYVIEFKQTVSEIPGGSYTDYNTLVKYGWRWTGLKTNNPNVVNPWMADAYCQLLVAYEQGESRTADTSIALERIYEPGELLAFPSEHKVGYVKSTSISFTPGNPFAMTLNMNFVREYKDGKFRRMPILGDFIRRGEKSKEEPKFLGRFAAKDSAGIVYKQYKFENPAEVDSAKMVSKDGKVYWSLSRDHPGLLFRAGYKRGGKEYEVKENLTMQEVSAYHKWMMGRASSKEIFAQAQVEPCSWIKLISTEDKGTHQNLMNQKFIDHLYDLEVDFHNQLGRKDLLRSQYLDTFLAALSSPFRAATFKIWVAPEVAEEKFWDTLMQDIENKIPYAVSVWCEAAREYSPDELGQKQNQKWVRKEKWLPFFEKPISLKNLIIPWAFIRYFVWLKVEKEPESPPTNYYDFGIISAFLSEVSAPNAIGKDPCLGKTLCLDFLKSWGFNFIRGEQDLQKVFSAEKEVYGDFFSLESKKEHFFSLAELQRISITNFLNVVYLVMIRGFAALALRHFRVFAYDWKERYAIFSGVESVFSKFQHNTRPATYTKEEYEEGPYGRQGGKLNFSFPIKYKSNQTQEMVTYDVNVEIDVDRYLPGYMYPANWNNEKGIYETQYEVVVNKETQDPYLRYLTAKKIEREHQGEDTSWIWNRMVDNWELFFTKDSPTQKVIDDRVKFLYLLEDYSEDFLWQIYNY